MSLANAAEAPFTEPGHVPGAPVPTMNPRLMPIVAAVVCAHGLALWALQTGLVRPPVVAETTVVMVADLIELAQPEVEPAPPPPPAPQPVPQREVPRKPRPAPQASPVATPVREPAPAMPIPPADSEPAASTAEPTMAPAAPAAPLAPPAPPAPPKVELPSSNASYLNNAKPPYPPMSRRLNEQGQVVVRVLIETDGTASQASIKTSSGYERLDRAALQTVQKWRYVPGKRGGVPEAMWFNIPLNFVLE